MNRTLNSALSAKRTSVVMALAGLSSIAFPLAMPAQMQMVSLTGPAVVQPLEAGVSSSRVDDMDTPAAPSTTMTEGRQGGAVPNGHSLLHSIGVEGHFGINGVGGDIAVPIARKWNVRLGGQHFGYTGHFTSDGAQIDATMHLGGGKGSVDWFPFGNGFHISPQVFFAIQTNVRGTVVVPAGQTISLDGGDYVSSAADPLTGNARISTRKVAPGLALGWGNISPRGSAHWSFPVEIGFYYIGQPRLLVNFKGTACDPTQPPAIGCENVLLDTGFQRDLANFIARNNNNLSYASFFPVAQFGVGYRF